MDFYFVDERGNDSVDFEIKESDKYKKASKYFQVGVLKTNKNNLAGFQYYFNSVRYFLNLTGEFETIVSAKKSFSKLWDIIENLARDNNCSILSTYIEKELYKGPYLYSKQSHKFRIFSFCGSLAYAMRAFKTGGSNKAQILIDRFPMSHDNELDAISYLKRNLRKYYNEIEVAFIDSRCSDYLQLIDVIITVIDEKFTAKNKKFRDYATDFIMIEKYFAK